MKKAALSLVFLAIAYASGFASTTSIKIESNLKEATVFLQGAQISRAATATIPAGTSELVISGVPLNIDQNSIQVKGKGSFMILSVSFRRDHLTDPKATELIQKLQDSLQYYKRQIDHLNALLKVYQEEESLILANKNLGGKETGFQISELKAAADFFRLRLAEIKKLWLDTNEDLAKNRERHDRIRNQLNQQQSNVSRAVGEIVVLVSAKSNIKGELDISYIFPGAGWVPVYDLRSKSIEDPFELNLKANVYQNSGEDWKDIQLTLSTGNPSRGGQIQYLNPWRLSFFQDIAIRGRSTPSQAPMMIQEADYAFDEVLTATQVSAPASTIRDHVTVSQAQTTVQYVINTPVTIAGDNNRRLIDINNHTIPAIYEYYAVPKLDTDAFLIAKVTGWEDYIVLPGLANLFFEGTFVGKSQIDPFKTKDTLDLSLGRDKSIAIKREKKKDITSRSFFGNRNIENVGWEINIRNNKRQNITLTILDQVPVPTHKDIDVSVSPKGALLNETTGILTWRLDLKTSEIKTVDFSYTVKYPKDKKVILE